MGQTQTSDSAWSQHVKLLFQFILPSSRFSIMILVSNNYENKIIFEKNMIVPQSISKKHSGFVLCYRVYRSRFGYYNFILPKYLNRRCYCLRGLAISSWVSWRASWKINAPCLYESTASMPMSSQSVITSPHLQIAKRVACATTTAPFAFSSQNKSPKMP